MQSTPPASTYSHPQLIQLIQQPQPEHDAAVRAVHAAETLVRDTRQALVHANQQLAQVQPQRFMRVALHILHEAEALEEDMQQTLADANQQLAQAQAQLQQAIPAQLERWQLVQKLQAMQRACWNRSLSAELSGLILCKTSRYNVKMVAVSCALLPLQADPSEMNGR